MLESLSLLSRSYIFHTGRCLIVVLAIIFAVAGLSAVLVLNENAKKSYKNATQPLLKNVHFQIVPRPGASLTAKDYARLRRAGLSRLVPVLTKRFAISDKPDSTTKMARFIGMDAFAVLSLPEQYRPSLKQENGSITKGFNQTWQQQHLLIHDVYAKELGVVDGEPLTLDNNGYTATFSVTDTSGLGRQIFADIGVLQSLLGSDELTALFLLGEVDQAKLNAVMPDHLKLQATNSGEDAEQLTGSFHLNLLAMALLMFVVCMFVVMNALNLLMVKRLRNLKILRQLGITRPQIFTAMLVEMLLLTLLLTPVGVFIGVQIAQFLSPSVYRTLENLYSVTLNFEQASYISLVLKSGITAVIGALAACTLPIMQLNQRLSGLTQTTSVGKQSMVWFAYALALSIAAFSIFSLLKGMFWVFTVVALLVFAGCALILALLPIVLVFLESTIPHHFPLVRWSLADCLRVSSHSKIAFCAFFIAISTNIGMNLMVDSFRQATDSWLTQRLNADGYLYSESPEALLSWSNQHHPNVTLIPRLTASGLINDSSTDVYSYPSTSDFQEAMAFDQATSDAWQHFENESGVFVNQQLAYSQQLSLNSVVNIRIDNRQFQRTVKGIYFDYGNPKKQILMPLKTLNKLASDNRMFAVFTDSPGELDTYFKQLLSTGIDARFYDTQSLLGLSMQTFNQTFVITHSLNIVTLLVAAFSLATSIIIIDMDSQRQRALMRCMGVSRKTLTLLGLAQYLFLSIIVCILAVPFGVGLSWLLINLVNVQAFNWSYPMLVEPDVILSTIMVSLLLMTVGTLMANLLTNKSTTLAGLRCSD